MKKKLIVSQPGENLTKQAGNCECQASEDSQNLIQQLQTHQIELEIQNEELRKIQAELERSRQKYLELFDFAPIGYFTFDRQGLIIEVNLTGCRMLGAKRRNMINTKFNRFVAPDHQDLFYFHCRNALETETKEKCDLKLVRKDGSYFYGQLESVAVENSDGGIEQFRAALTDITERKQAEDVMQRAQEEMGKLVKDRTAELETINKELHQKVVECSIVEAALRESEQKYSTLVEDALIGVYIIKDGKIEFANDKFASIYGYTKNELIGLESVKLVHAKDRPRVKEMREKRLKGEKVPSEYEIRGLKKNGDTIWVMRSFSVINYKDGPAISGIVSDMTERKKAEEALRESGKEMRILSNQLLSAEEKERKRIARELHDSIGQALSAVKFSIENSLRQLRKLSDPSELKALEAVIPLIQKTIEEVRGIVKDLRPSILDDLGIKATITWLCREFTNVYTDIRIKRVVDIQEDVIPSPLKTVIYRILQEALNNVAKHSQADSVQLTLKKTDGWIKFIIKDLGVGFDVDQVLSQKPSRRGFGLASMRERAELSGAEFDIKSVTGQGTTIMVKWKC